MTSARRPGPEWFRSARTFMELCAARRAEKGPLTDADLAELHRIAFGTDSPPTLEADW